MQSLFVVFSHVVYVRSHFSTDFQEFVCQHQASLSRSWKINIHPSHQSAGTSAEDMDFVAQEYSFFNIVRNKENSLVEFTPSIK